MQKTQQIKLGDRPKSFTKTVKFPMLDGTEGAMQVIYKYRTRKEFGAFIDELTAEAELQTPAEKFSMRDLMEKTAGANAAYILRVIDGWSLDEPFSLASVQQLADELPAAAMAIMDDYRAAVTEGRLGN